MLVFLTTINAITYGVYSWNVCGTQYFWISRRSPDYRPLKVAYIVKGIITILLLCLVNVFGIALFYKNDDVGGEFLIVLAFLFTPVLMNLVIT